MKAPFITLDDKIESNVYEIKNYHGTSSAFFNVYKGESDPVCNEIKKGKMWEPHLADFLEKHMSDDFVVIEAGTHIGSHTVKIAKMCHTIYGFEPFPYSNALLKKNLLLNNVTNVKIFDSALSNTAQTIQVNFHDPYMRNSGGWGIHFTKDYENNDDQILDIKCITIDSLNLERLDFIKLDVEGNELNVIKGGINTIKKFKPLIVLEWWAEYPNIDIRHTRKTFKILTDLGYSVTYLNKSVNKSEGCPDFVFWPGRKRLFSFPRFWR